MREIFVFIITKATLIFIGSLPVTLFVLKTLTFHRYRLCETCLSENHWLKTVTLNISVGLF